MINKEELLSVFKDKDFVKNVMSSITEVIGTVSHDTPKYGVDKIIENGHLPFERRKDLEEKAIEEALNEINFNDLKKLVKAITIISDDMAYIYDGDYYDNENEVKEDLREQLRNTFSKLDEYPVVMCFTGGSKGEMQFTYMIDGRFYTEASYWKNDETNEWEPFVTVRFSPIEYLNY